MPRVYLSLGSNLEPERHLGSALRAITRRYGTLALSRTYQTPAVGFAGPPFWNLAAAFDSDEALESIDAWLHALEDAHGRRRDVPRFSSRTLDVDVLLYGDRVQRGPGNLEVPRGELSKHAFVLAPMLDLAPSLRHPVLGETLATLHARLPPAEREAPVAVAASWRFDTDGPA